MLIEVKYYKKIVGFLLKLIISGGLVAWVIIYKINFYELGKSLESSNVQLLAIAFLMKFLGIVISSLRWNKLLEFQNIKVKFRYLLDSHIVAMFFNNFLPTRIGGDIVRINDLRKASQSIYRSASTVFIERFMGIAILLFFAFCASLIRLPLAQNIPAIWIGLVLGTTGVGIIILILRFNILGVALQKMPATKSRDNLLAGWDLFRGNSMSLISKKKPLAMGLLFSALLQLNVVIHFWIIGEAFDFKVSLIDYFFIIPIQLVILMLPSINGIGLREASCIFLFSAYGITANDATLFGFTDFVMLLMMGFIGWLRFLTRGVHVITRESD